MTPPTRLDRIGTGLLWIGLDGIGLDWMGSGLDAEFCQADLFEKQIQILDVKNRILVRSKEGARSGKQRGRTQSTCWLHQIERYAINDERVRDTPIIDVLSARERAGKARSYIENWTHPPGASAGRYSRSPPAVAHLHPLRMQRLCGVGN